MTPKQREEFKKVLPIFLQELQDTVAEIKYQYMYKPHTPKNGQLIKKEIELFIRNFFDFHQLGAPPPISIIKSKDGHVRLEVGALLNS